MEIPITHVITEVLPEYIWVPPNYEVLIKDENYDAFMHQAIHRMKTVNNAHYEDIWPVGEIVELQNFKYWSESVFDVE